MTLLPANADILKKRFPSLYECLLLPHKEKEIAKQISEKNYYGKDPEVTFNRWASQISIREKGCYVLCGFGNGFHIEKLLSLKESKGAVFIVIESSINHLKNVFSYYDCSKILSSNRLYFISGKKNENNNPFDVLKTIDYQIISDINYILYTPLYFLDEDYYNTCLSKCVQVIKELRKCQVTQVEDAQIWQAQTIKNLKHLLFEPDISAAKGTLQGVPLILVGAGPSLDLAYGFLKQAKNKAIIVAVNSAYRALYLNGIRPHLTIAADPRPSTFMGYEDAQLEGVYFIGPYKVNSQVVKSFKGRTFTWSTQNPLVDYFCAQLQFKQPSKIEELGTVATSIGSLAALLGSKKVCLVGQDFAVLENGQTHAKDSFYGKYGYPPVDKESCRLMPGNTLTQVLCEEKLAIYLALFEEMLSRYPQIEFINTSKLGAKLKNSPYYPFEKALEWLGPQSSSIYFEKFKKSYASLKTVQLSYNYSTIYNDLMTYAREICEQALLYILTYKSSGTISASFYFKSLMHLLKQHSFKQAILFGGKTKRELNNYIKYFDDKPSGIKNKEFCWAIAEGAFQLHKELNLAL